MKAFPQDASWQAELRDIASMTGRPFDEIESEARRDLQELGGRRGRVGTALFAALSRFIRRRGYSNPPVYDLTELQQVRDAMRNGSVVFLVSHKTYLDFFVLYEFFHYLGITPPRIFGGANMAFAGFGLLARQAGGIFIRRSFRDDPVYKAALRHRLRTLIRQGESFMWAIEGTRSRTGKLLIPKLGLLHYVTDSSKQLEETAVRFIPVAVVYDRIPDVADMAAQDAGASKSAESLAWFMGYLRSLGENFGDIHLRFGQPMALHETPAAPDLAETGEQADDRADDRAEDRASHQAEVQKLAFEACFRINQVSAATPTSLVLLSVLCHGQRGPRQIPGDVRELARRVRAASPTAQEQSPSRQVDDGSDRHIDEQVAALLRAGVLQSTRSDAADGVRVPPEALSMAIYYSNMAAHHFVIPAFVELALAVLMQRGKATTHADFLDECRELRELYKYEFFFSRKDEFRQQLLAELKTLAPGLREPFAPATLRQCVDGMQLRVAVGVLSPYLEAYRRAAAWCLQHPGSASQADAMVLDELMAESRRAASTSPAGQPGSTDQPLPELGVSRALLANGLLVAGNYGLRDAREAGPGQDEVAQPPQHALLTRLAEIEAALGVLAAMNRGVLANP